MLWVHTTHDGDSSIYSAAVLMAQDFHMPYPVIDGQGNFGSIDGDAPASSRYTEARISKFGKLMFFNSSFDYVNTRMNYDDTLEEPSILAPTLPFYLLAPSKGIGVGYATNTVAHKLDSVIKAVKAYVARSHTPRRDQARW